MADGGGITYTVTADTSDYDSSIKKAGETAKSTFSDVDKSAKNAATGTDKLTEAKERLMRKIERLKQAIEEQAAEVQKATNEYGVNSEQADKAAEKQYQLEKQLEAAEKQLAKMDDTMSDASKDMGTMSDAADDASKAVDNLGDDAKTASKDEKSLGDEAKIAGDKVDKMAERAEAGGKKIETASKRAFAAIGAAVGASIGIGVNFNKQMETYQTSFEVMTGSYETAANLVEELKNRAAATPFDLTDLADTTQLLMNYGFTTDNVISSMEMLGDIAQGDSDKLTRVATAYGQMSSAGKVSLEDVKQMIEAGFNPLQEITETTGESMGSLYERISKGTISVDEITAAMVRSTSEGGKYYKSMDKQSQTLQGRWNTLKDTFAEATDEMSTGISDWLRDDGIPAAIEAVEWLAKNFDNLIPYITTATAAAITFIAVFKAKDAVETVMDIAAALGTTSGQLALVISALVAMAGVVYTVTGNMIAAEEPFMTLTEKERDMIQQTRDAASAWSDLNSAAYENIEAHNTQIGGLEKLVGSLKNLADENGYVTEANRDRVAYILGELNSAFGTEYTMIDGQIQKYDELIGTIDDVIAAHMRQYAIDNLTGPYLEALGEQDQLLNAIKLSEQGLADQSQIVADARAKAEGSTSLKLQMEAEKQEATLAKMQEAHGELVQSWKDGQYTIQNMNQLTSLSVDATKDDVANAFATTEQDVADAEKAYSIAMGGMQEDVGNMARATLAGLQGVDGGFKETARNAQEQSDTVVDRALAQDRFYNAAIGAKNAVENGFKPDLKSSGVNAVDGAIVGINSRSGKLFDLARSLGSRVQKYFNFPLKINSPSRAMAESGKFVVEGVAEGIEDAAHIAEQAASDLGKGVETSFDMRMATPDMDAMAAGAALQSVQTSELYSNIAAQMTSAPIHVHLDVDGTEIADAIALPMSYSLESLRIAEARG